MRIVYPEMTGTPPAKPAPAVIAATVLATEAAAPIPVATDPRSRPSPSNAISSDGNLSAELAFERIAASVKFNLVQIQNNIEHARSDSLKFFKLTMICVSFGFILAVFGILISMIFDTKMGYATTLCGSVPELIAVLFFRKDQELRKTIEKYHEELLMSQNILTMIDVAETIDNEMERDKIKQQIIVLRLNIPAAAPAPISA